MDDMPAPASREEMKMRSAEFTGRPEPDEINTPFSRSSDFIRLLCQLANEPYHTNERIQIMRVVLYDIQSKLRLQYLQSTTANFHSEH
jgi:hypothetical protein